VFRYDFRDQNPATMRHFEWSSDSLWGIHYPRAPLGRAAGIDFGATVISLGADPSDV